MRRAVLILALALLALPSQAWSQAVCANPGSSGGGPISGIVNTYFQGNSNLAPLANSLVLGTRDTRGASDSIVVGDLLMIMQMQDGTINSSNSNNYGDGSGSGQGTTSVGNAGLHEFVTVTATTGTGAGATVTFTPPLTNSYTQSAATAATAQKRYQILRVPQYTAATAAGITAPAWGFGVAATGETGGVVAVDVRDTLTLGSSTVEGQTNRAFFLGGKGFRGAAGDASAAANGSNADWVSLASSTNQPAAPVYQAHGGKGEGIAGTPRFFVVKDQWGFQATNAVATAANLSQIDYGISVYAAGVEGYPGGAHARGAPGNAGGGGTDGRNPNTSNDENAGGGGGGSYAAGGLGGRPWNAPLVDSDGRGGAGYPATLAFNRLFLGGGGGAGSTNNATADPGTYANQAMSCNLAAGLCSSGAAGGGVVVVRARAITGGGVIDVRGAHAYNVLNDAGGGGGAGGSVVIYSIDGGSATIDASGGDGGNAWAGNQGSTANRHGPGGGGGGGFVVYAPPTMSVNATLVGGTPGITTNGTDTYASGGNNGGSSTFAIPNTPGVIPGALCAPDLHLTKDDGLTSVTPGQNISYTLTVTNSASAATSSTIPVTVVDVLPATLFYTGPSPFVSGIFTCSLNLGPPQSITCTSTTPIVPIAAGGTATISLPVTVSVAATPGAVTNQAQAGGGGDPNEPVTPDVGSTSACTGNDVPVAGCAVDEDVIQSPLLSLTKDDGTDTVIAGQPTTYTLTVSNSGSAASSSTTPITVVDVLPVGLTYSGPASFVSGIFSCTYSNATFSFTCTTSSVIAVGNSAAISIPVMVAATAPGALTNLAQVGGGGDPGKTTTPSVASASACPAPTPPATRSSDPSTGCAADTDSVRFVNLTLTKDDGVPFVYVGGQTTYTFTVTNNGNAASLGIINFRDELPAGLSWPAVLTVGGANAADWSCALVGVTDTQGVTCASSVPVAAGASSKFSLIVSAAGVTNGTQYLNKARISGGADADLLPGAPTTANVNSCISNNNPAGCALDLDTASQATIRMTKSHPNPQAHSPGDTFAFTLAVTNSGGLDSGGANTIRVIDVLPASLAFSGVSPFTSGLFNCTVAGQTITCDNTAAIAAGATSNITFNVVVAASVSNTVVNPAKVGTTGADPSNNTLPTAATAGACTGTNTPTVGCAIDTVPLNTDLQITKSDGSTTYTPGTATIYTIVARNAGPSNVIGAVVADTLPAAVTSATWTVVYAGGATGPAGGSGNINATLNLPVAATATFTVTANIGAGASGSLANTSTVTAPAGISDTNPANNTATDTDTAAPIMDLAIAKTDGVTSAIPGTSVTYTITVTNTGPSDAVGATVADTLPAALTGVTWTCISGAGTCTASGSGNISDTVNVPVGATLTYTVIGTINPNATGTLANTATVTVPSGATDPTPGNNTATDTDTLTPQADLAITKTDGSATYAPGGTTTYTIVATNNGVSNVFGATVADALPAAITSASWTAVYTGGGAGPASGSGNINAIVNLPSGATATFTVVANINAAASGNLVNTAMVAVPAGTTDPVPGNNSMTDTDTPAPSADLSITKTDGSTTYTPGGTTTYTIVATNNGPSNVTGATVADTLPAAITSANWTAVYAGGGTGPAGGSGNINASVNLLSGATATFTVVANISASASGNLVNIATVAVPAGVTDPIPGNNSATDTDTLSASADLSITKNDGVVSTTAGGTTTYTIVATNNGPSNVTGATVADTLPAAITSANWTAVYVGGGTGPASGSGNINASVNLPSGATATFTVVANISPSASGNLVNTATVAVPAGVTDPNPGNNSDTDTDTLGASADLAVTKTDGTTAYTPGTTTTYSVVVTNNGPSTATGASIADVMPAAITSDNWTATATGGATGFSASGSGNINDTVTMPPGSTITYIVVANISIAATGSLMNTATATDPPGTADPIPGNNSDTDTDTNGGSPQLTIVKTATPSAFAVGQTGTYSLNVSNTGNSSSAGTISVVDLLPTGITTTGLPVGAGWNCSASTTTLISCTTAAVLLPLSNAPVINVPVAIAAGTASPAINTAMVSGGGDGGCPAAARCSSTISTPVNAPMIDVSKVLQGSLVVGVPTTYLITATNNGQAATLAGTITDTIPTGLTIGALPAGCSPAGGQNISCLLPAGIATGGSVSYIIPVTPQPSVSGQNVSNTATANNGGDPTCPGAVHCDGVTTDTVTAPQLQLLKSASPTTFVANQPSTYTLTVTNVGTAATTAVTTISDTIPTGLTIGALPAGCSPAGGQDITCTVASGLAINSPVTFVIPVTPQASVIGQSVTNTAGATGGGDPGCATGTPIGSLPARCVGTVTTPVNAPQLTIVKTASTANFIVGVAASYTLQVTNTGTAPTNATATVTDVIPGNLTIGTLPAGCTSSGQQVTCTVASGLATGNSVSFTIPVTPTAAAGGTTLSNTASVLGGGDPTCPVAPNCSSTITTPVDAPQLTIVKTASTPNFTVGSAASYTLQVTNTGSAATTATVIITDVIPGALTIGVLPAGCTSAGQTVTCTIAAGLAINTPVSFTIPVTPTAAASGTTLTNTANVSGGGDPGCPGAANCSSTVNTPVDAPQLLLQKTASAPSFVVGVAASYTLTVTNIGSAATTAATTVTDIIPATLTIGALPAGCTSVGQTVTCIVVTGLAVNSPVNFVIPVTPTAAANGTTLTNTATVTGGGDPTCPGAVDCTSTVNTPVGAPMLQVVKTASAASFAVNTPASYTLTVTNVGGAATTAVATVSDTIPASLTINSVPAGCTTSGQQVTCTIAAGLAVGAGNALSFTIAVTPTAAAGGTTLTNTATVVGGGDPTCPGATDCSSTVITPVGAPVMQIVKTGPATATAGQNIAYAITVTNVGAASASNVILTDPAPTGLTYVSAGAPCTASGFPCNLGTMNVGQSITVNATFTIAPTFVGSIINTATVISDQTSQSSSSASTVVAGAVGTPPQPVPLDARWAMLLLMGLLTLAGVWQIRARR